MLAISGITRRRWRCRWPATSSSRSARPGADSAIERAMQPRASTTPTRRRDLCPAVDPDFPPTPNRGTGIADASGIPSDEPGRDVDRLLRILRAVRRADGSHSGTRKQPQPGHRVSTPITSSSTLSAARAEARWRTILRVFTSSALIQPHRRTAWSPSSTAQPSSRIRRFAPTGASEATDSGARRLTASMERKGEKRIRRPDTDRTPCGHRDHGRPGVDRGPGYRQYVLRTHRTEARGAAQRVAAQEKFYLFPRTTSTPGLRARPPRHRPGSDSRPRRKGWYAVAITAADVTGFSATVTAQGSPGGG